VRAVIALLRAERRARWFFVALTQSALGTGAAYVALLLVAFDRFESPWAISLVLIADLLPAMLLGPVFGAVADRWSRRWCCVAADAVRAGAFLGIAVVDGFVPTIALAALAGTGTALFTPASLAGLPSLVHEERRPAAMSLYGAIADLGFTAGPALAALVLAFGAAEDILIVNGISFALCGAILALIPFGEIPEDERRKEGMPAPTLFQDTREGLAVVVRLTGVRVVIAGSAAALFFGGIFNVGELLFAKEDLETTDAGYSILVALFGLGFVGGSLAGSGGGSAELLRRRFLQGCALMGLGFLLSGLAPTLVVALLTFTLAGYGNGLLLVHERVIVQEMVPDRLLGRAFGVKDALASWAFGTAFLAAGGVLTLIDARGLIAAAGVGALIVTAVCALAFRRESLAQQAVTRSEALAAMRRSALGSVRAEENGPDVVRSGDVERTLLDHVD
jgi:MFS family permease